MKAGSVAVVKAQQNWGRSHGQGLNALSVGVVGECVPSLIHQEAVESVVHRMVGGGLPVPSARHRFRSTKNWGGGWCSVSNYRRQ